MTVYDFLGLATEDSAEVEIFNLASEKSEILTVNEARFGEYGKFEVLSFDSFITNNMLTINIDTSEE